MVACDCYSLEFEVHSGELKLFLLMSCPRGEELAATVVLHRDGDQVAVRERMR